ncbi:MAG: acyl-CoA dehydrogenase family protein [Tunicatimonas sp.]|uniref:acyl-CoA dehydrogenase family protein n=1 Tax=Tunicatimonas sp. TaxID=1940096 RepID=UPI003C71A371
MESIISANKNYQREVLTNAAHVSEQLATIREQQQYGADDDFPFQEFHELREADLLQITLPDQPLDFATPTTRELLNLLKLVGKGNLSVGRIYEGHINALYLIHLFGTTAQQQYWYQNVQLSQHLFGVWNTQMNDGITIQDLGDGKYQLQGCKTFCSGAQWVTRPIITGKLLSERGEDLGWQMVVVPLDEQEHLPVDDSFWKPLGMKASVSHKIDFSQVVLTDQDLLGNPDDYHQQPHFSGGAIRFAAVHLGGAEAIFDATRNYLQKLMRTNDPYQQMRLGEMAALIESGNLWINSAGERTDGNLPSDVTIQYANMVRTAIEKICLDTLRLSERCVGARGLLYPEPFARLHADLTTYLRQPAPDQALAQVGAYVGTQKSPAHDLW